MSLAVQNMGNTISEMVRQEEQGEKKQVKEETDDLDDLERELDMLEMEAPKKVEEPKKKQFFPESQKEDPSNQRSRSTSFAEFNNRSRSTTNLYDNLQLPSHNHFQPNLFSLNNNNNNRSPLRTQTITQSKSPLNKKPAIRSSPLKEAPEKSSPSETNYQSHLYLSSPLEDNVSKRKETRSSSVVAFDKHLDELELLERELQDL